MESSEDHRRPTVTENSTGRLVVKYLQKNVEGATASDILHHLREEMKGETRDLDKVVESILENGTALGFLERKGSHYMNWMARHQAGRKRRLRSVSRRRARKARRKQSRCPPRGRRH